MSAIITCNDDNLYTKKSDHLGLKLQYQITKIYRQLNSDLFANTTDTQSVSDRSTDYGSYPGVGSSLQGILRAGDQENASQLFDTRNWLKSIQTINVDEFVSTPSLKKTTVYEWLTYIQNDLTLLKERDQIAERISLLAYDADTHEGVSIDLESLTTFIMFIQSNKIEKRPRIGLRSNGCIDALWQKSKDELVEIIFFPGHESQVVTFSTDLVSPEVTNRRVATLPIVNIMDIISSRNLDALFFSGN